MSATKKYTYAIGRRKQNTAVVKLFSGGTGKFFIVKQDGVTIELVKHFGGNVYLFENAVKPFHVIGSDTIKSYDMEIKIEGGGIAGQSDSIKLGISRALITINPEWKPMLKAQGLLMRDPRRKERKKPGLRKARKSPKRSKR